VVPETGTTFLQSLHPPHEDKSMALAGLLQQSAIIPAMKANSKKQMLQELAAKAAKLTGIPETPVDFEALDDQPVDLVFLLLAPEGAGADHLKALSRIARVLRDPTMVAKLRASDSESAIYACLSEEQASNAA
jgi:nitrogen PTS system EIIA component